MSDKDFQSEEKLDFYQQLRDKIRAWVKGKGIDYKFADILLTAPDMFHLLCKLALDKDVPVREKAKLASTIAYFVSPVDLLPEAVAGPVGYIDDVALAAFVLNGIINNTSPEIVQRHWAGDEDILDLIKHILQVADEMVGSGLWSKIQKLLTSGDKN